MSIVASCLLFVVNRFFFSGVYCSLFVVRCLSLLFASLGCLLFIGVRCALFVVGCSLFVVGCVLLLVVRRALFVVGCSVFVVREL